MSAKVPKGEECKRPLELRGFAVAMRGKAEEGTKDGRKALFLLGVARKVLAFSILAMPRAFLSFFICSIESTIGLSVKTLL